VAGGHYGKSQDKKIIPGIGTLKKLMHFSSDLREI
jgi:hypothetical protein